MPAAETAARRPRRRARHRRRARARPRRRHRRRRHATALATASAGRRTRAPGSRAGSSDAIAYQQALGGEHRPVQLHGPAVTPARPPRPRAYGAPRACWSCTRARGVRRTRAKNWSRRGLTEQRIVFGSRSQQVVAVRSGSAPVKPAGVAAGLPWATAAWAGGAGAQVDLRQRERPVADRLLICPGAQQPRLASS